MPDADIAWNDDLLRDPHRVADKRTRVQRMFAAIAPKYDLNNRLHSFGMDQRWRKKAVAIANLALTDRVLDVACGTGDLTSAFANQLERLEHENSRRYKTPQYVWARTSPVLGVDFTFAMLPIASSKAGYWSRGSFVRPDGTEVLADCAIRNCWYVNADATALPLVDASADVVSIAFGIRNVQEPAKALAEFFRVLRPGGRVIILEFSQPTNPVIRFFNDLYCKRIMPHTATWISGDRTGAYMYLPKSVESFMSREQMMTMLRDAGFVDVTQHPMTFGVAVVYRGYKR